MKITPFIEKGLIQTKERILFTLQDFKCYSKSKYLEASLTFYSYGTGKSVANLNLPIGRLFIISKWSDDFHYIKPKKIIASMDAARIDKIERNVYNNSFPHAKVIYSLSATGIDYAILKCN